MVSMVEKAIILETIKKMYASGLGDDVIESTLRDIGLSGREIKETLAEAKSSKEPAPEENPNEPAEENTGQELEPPEEEPELHERIAETTAQKLREQFDEKRSEDSLAHATTQAAIAGYDSRLAEISERLAVIENKLGSLSGAPLSDFSSKAVLLDKKISSMESDLSELKAISNALKSLLEKVLDTDRAVLTELEEKK